MITEEIVHIKGHPKKLIVFLHGYIDSPDYVDGKISLILDNMDDVAIHIPKSPMVCEIYPKKYQWYSMHRFDDNDDRKTVATMEECVNIYNRMKAGIFEASNIINPYIDRLLNEYQLEDKDLYICGYSQGATLAIYTALMRENEVAGLISFSGIIAPEDYLSKKHKTTPKTLLIHGDVDNQVRYEALGYTKKILEGYGCKVSTLTIKKGQHRITEEGMNAALNFIENKKAIRKVAV